MEVCHNWSARVHLAESFKEGAAGVAEGKHLVKHAVRAAAVHAVLFPQVVAQFGGARQ